MLVPPGVSGHSEIVENGRLKGHDRDGQSFVFTSVEVADSETTTMALPSVPPAPSAGASVTSTE
jgi:hypothetical protein